MKINIRRFRGADDARHRAVSHLNPLRYEVDALRAWMLVGGASDYGLARRLRAHRGFGGADCDSCENVCKDGLLRHILRLCSPKTPNGCRRIMIPVNRARQGRGLVTAPRRLLRPG